VDGGTVTNTHTDLCDSGHRLTVPVVTTRTYASTGDQWPTLCLPIGQFVKN